MVRGFSLFEPRCGVFFSVCFTDGFHCTVELVASLPPTIAALYVYVGLGIILLLSLHTLSYIVIVISNWALYLAIGSSFVGSVIVEAFRFSLSTAQLIAS